MSNEIEIKKENNYRPAKKGELRCAGCAWFGSGWNNHKFWCELLHFISSPDNRCNRIRSKKILE